MLPLSLLSRSASRRRQPLAPNEVKALLGRIRAKRAAAPQVQADFQEEKDVHLMNKPINSSGKVWFAAPDKFRREVKGNSPSLTVSDGQQLWIYYPKFQSAEHYSLGKHSPLDAGVAALTAALNLQNVENSYHITASTTANGYQLQLAPRNPSLKRLLQTFTIQLNADLQVQRTEMAQPNGDHIVTAYANESRAAIASRDLRVHPAAGHEHDDPLGTSNTSGGRTVKIAGATRRILKSRSSFRSPMKPPPCRLCLARIVGSPNEIIVVDAASDDQTVALARSRGLPRGAGGAAASRAADESSAPGPGARPRFCFFFMRTPGCLPSARQELPKRSIGAGRPRRRIRPALSIELAHSRAHQPPRQPA